MTTNSSTVSGLLERVRRTPGCRVNPPDGMPSIEPKHVLPDDLKEFYGLCGGVELFEMSAYRLAIVPPTQFVLANPVILIGLTQQQMESFAIKLSWSWYILGKGDNSHYITIDLDPKRLGRCYDSFWELHPENSVVIASSFTEFLERMLDNKGKLWFWHAESFGSLKLAHEE